MDGFDISVIDQIDQDIFNGSPFSDSDEEEELPLPEYIGIDSAVQDEERDRICEQERQIKKRKTKSETERELEVKCLKTDSIRRQILERSLDGGHNKISKPPPGNTDDSSDSNSAMGTHVMNIVEKAGMSGIDKDKINGIIHEASKGSLFYKKQAQRQEEIHRSIEKMLTKVKMATPLQIANAKTTCDKLVDELEKQRLFNKIIVHFDLDMFFAAVEIRDNPELQDKPVAVGGDSMVSTSNYVARKYGVRAAMPGFIAKKLCPNLILIKPNGVKYRQASADVFGILEQYDPEFTSMSLDEAYLDLTEHIKNCLELEGYEIQEYYDGTLPRIWWTRSSEVVQEIRDAIHAKTQLTCSAGISCNTLLSKIATDMRKPNGQFMIPGYPKEISEFINETPVGKVSGIGKVSSQFLNALDIKTCGDIYRKRHFLPLVFYDINVKFYLRVALGDGSTCIKSDEQRKSKSVERTFAAIRDTLKLLDKLDSICDELCNKYLKPYRIRGRTVTVKLKRNTFTTTTKSYSLLVPTNDKLVIYSAAKNLLLSEVAQEPPEISYRLLGVRLSNLVDEGVNSNQLTIDAMLRHQELTRMSNEVSDKVLEKNDLESHVPLTEDGKNDIEMTLNQKPEQQSVKMVSIKIESKKSKGKKQTKLSGSKSSQCTSFHKSTQGTPKISFYQKFMESNSQSFSQSPKFEPFQCPYCMHGFVNFGSLETHVMICSKNNNR